jgi:molecular chaperone GrpE
MMPRDPEEPKSNDDDILEAAAEAEGTEETEAIDEALAGEKAKAAEYLASWQRAQADFANYKRRTEQERQDFCAFANADLVRALLPVLDDLDRALEHIPPKYSKSDWVEGVRAVARKFRTALEAQGVKPIEALGQPFDPNFHEAMRQDAGPEGVVIQEYQKGYTLNDKLLRCARVVVGSGEDEDHTETSPDEITKF